MRLLPRLAATTFLVSLSLASTSARGADADPEELFAEGARLMEQSRFEDALPKLLEAQRLDPGIGTQFNIAVCYEKLGRLGSAHKNFTEVLNLARAAGKKQREEATRARLEAIEPRLSLFVIRTVDTTDVTVRLDGTPLPKAQWSKVPVDPGPHKIEAIAPLKKPWSTEVSAPAEGQRAEIVVPALEAVRGETKVVTVTRDTTSGRRTLGFALGGVGLAGLAAAAVTGLVLLDAKSTADERCPEGRCVRPDGTVDSEGADAVNLGRTLLPVNAIAWAVGLIGVGTGTFFILTASKRTEPGKVAVTPLVAPHGASVGLRAAF